MANDDAPGFEKVIRPMFTEKDVAHMKPLGIDLSDAAAVQAHAGAIYGTVTDGTMPPRSSGEERWSPEMCERFKRHLPPEGASG